MKIQGIVTTIVLTLSLIIISTTTAAALSCTCGDICVNESGWWRDSGALTASTTPIQAAVDNAGGGETICVKAGSYTENVDITTPHLTLRGEGADVVIVTAASSSDPVFEVTADYVNISGFNATGAVGESESCKAGFCLDSADHCNISENTANSNDYYGIYLSSSSNNTLASNNCSNNYNGIWLDSSSNNTLASNNASNNYYGIKLYSSSSNILASNNVNSNSYLGICLSSSSNNTFTSNNVNSNNDYGICLSGSSDNTLASNNCSNNDYGICLSGSSDNTLASNNCSNSDYGIYLVSSSSSNVCTGNNASNNYYGIWLFGSSDNMLTSNNANSNNDKGIYLSYSSSSNILIGNNCSNNGYGIYLYDSCNNNTLASNNASNNDKGIYLSYSSNNMLESNNASNNYYGIWLFGSSDNTLASNKMSENMYNFGKFGSSLSECTHNIDSSNTVNGKPIYYWVDQKDRQIPNDAGFVGVVNGTNITVRDLKLTNNGEGVLFAYTENSRIENVTTSNNYYGIILDFSSDNTLASNIANLNNQGIWLVSSCNNTLAINTANSNNNRGIYLLYSSNNTLVSNTASSNGDHGIYLHHLSNNTLTNNTVNLNGDHGISLRDSNDNTLTNNIANLNGDHGISLSGSSNNMLTNNIANSNGYYGIRLGYSSSNLIYNNFFNNTENAYDNGNNQWNTTKTNGTNIIGGPFLGGNYWSDYAGVDNDGDGLGDTQTPYNSLGGITNGGDYHPLVPAAAPDPTYIPPDPVNLTHTQGNYWVNYAWSPGTGNVTDNYNVNLNGAWTNGTASTFANTSVGPGGWANITVFAYNASGTGTLSAGSVSKEVQAPCADDTTPPVITITKPVPHELYIVGMTLDFSATDDESGVDTIIGNLTNASGVSQDVDSGFSPGVGVYTMVVTATDNAGNTNESDPVFFVVYDRDGGHTTGGGCFYPYGDSTLPACEANFGFTARYKDGSSTGNLNFQYNDADLHLKSTSIDWLTISAVSAQFQGTGTINGKDLYTFRVKAKDNGEPGVDVDHFDIKIWNGTDTEADPIHNTKNTISGGNIQVYTK